MTLRRYGMRNALRFLRTLEGGRAVLGIALSGAVVSLAGSGALALVRQPHTNEFLRGEEIATRMGCFACHGAGGLAGAPNPGSPVGEVPGFRLGGSIRFYVQSEPEITEWILYGAPRRLLGDASPARGANGAVSQADAGLIRMPAYQGLLLERELQDLVVFVRTVAALEQPGPPEVEKGRQLAFQMGCFGCHGIDGRGGPSNPGSFKGYIPPWDGSDFAELVRDDAELRQWILEGRIDRFEASPLATYFTHGQVIQMPAYRDVLKPAELEAIIGYVHWLREDPRPVGEHWVEAEAPALASRVERGEWLYREAGCIVCHGAEGRGDLAAGEAVPALNDLAEKMELFEREEVDAIVRALEDGRRLEELVDAPPVARFDAVLAQYRSHFDVILRGAHPTKRRREGAEPPMPMPGWQQRWHADGGPSSAAEIDSILLYLLTVPPFEDEEPE